MSKKMSLRRSTFKLSDGRLPAPNPRADSPAQPPLSHGQIVIEVKSERSASSASHRENQVDVRRYPQRPPTMSPAHGSLNNLSPTKFGTNPEPLYKVWTGEQLFFFNGKIQLGINVWQPLVTFCLVNVLQLCLLSNTIADLLRKKDGYEAVLAVGIVLAIVASVFLWVTAAKDPATVPSRVFLYKAFRRRTDLMSDDLRSKYLDVVGGRLTKMKYCSACDIYRPPRTIHCGTCGCCIERLDHHCPWLGTCVGKRNYKYFITFLWAVFLMVIYSIVFCSIHVSYDLSED